MSKKQSFIYWFKSIFHSFFIITVTALFSSTILNTKLSTSYSKPYELSNPPRMRIHGFSYPGQDRVFYHKSNSYHFYDEVLTENYENTQLDDDGNLIFTGGAYNIVYFNQNDPRWADETYGPNDRISVYGCGPTALASIVSSLTDQKLNPVEASNWAYQNGYHSDHSGSYHALIPDGAKSFGLKAESITNYSAEAIIQELNTGKLVVVLMGKGHFTANGHFIILRGTTLDGKILISDPKSLENSVIEWDIETIIEEAKYGSSSGGPMWSIQK